MKDSRRVSTRLCRESEGFLGTDVGGSYHRDRPGLLSGGVQRFSRHSTGRMEDRLLEE